jgi:nondiscriminating glutamyl-tRNA synthetase
MNAAATKQAVRVRFPPSPTGRLHLGNARTFLINWLFAKQHKGEVVLRIEDTDKSRSEQKYEIEIIEALRWLGLTWDEGPDWHLLNGEWQTTSKGEYGPYRQSERTDLYKSYLEQLLSEGKAYYCYCTKEELEAEKQSFTAQGLPPKYSGHCRNLASLPAGRSPESIRFRTPEAHVTFKDLVRGTVTFDATLFGDVIIAKNLESSLYNFAVTVDDHLMRITHVIRGEEHLANTPKQILMQKALGFDEPVYAHLPLILAANRSKLSKRYMDVALMSYRDRGYLPEALVNFLVLLGWHPQGNEEILSIQELVGQFDMKRVQKAGAVFNEEKLDWLNGEYIKRIPIDELVARLRPLAAERKLEATDDLLRAVVTVERERMATLTDFFEHAGFFFELPDYAPTLLPWKNDPPATTKEILEQLHSMFETMPDDGFNRATILAALQPFIEARGRGTVLWPLRAALSGLPASPDPLVIAEVLGRGETLRRITVARNKIGLAF